MAAPLFRLASRLAGAAPVPAAYQLAASAGRLYASANPAHAAHAIRNFAVVLAQPPADPAVRRLAAASFANYGMAVLDSLRLGAMQPAQAERGVLVRGWELLDDALAVGRGLILCTGHIGSWDRAATIVGGRGYPVHVLVDTFRPPALDTAVRAARARHGLHLIAADQPGALRQTFRALERNEIVALLVDRPDPAGTAVSLFGQTALLPGGPAALAVRTGAPVAFGYLVRRPDLVSFQGEFLPVPCAPHGPRAERERAQLQAIAARLQATIQRFPTQWAMFRTMWPAAASRASAA